MNLSGKSPMTGFRKPKQQNKYRHLTWKESRPENKDLRDANEVRRQSGNN